MKRISAEDVLSAYRATGLKPLRGTALVRDGTCALGALCQQKNGHRQTVYDWAEEEFGKDYIVGFMFGFDYETGDGVMRSIAFRDGRAAAAAVFAESPAGEPR